MKINTRRGAQIFRGRCAQCNGIIHFAASDDTGGHGFASAIVEGLRKRSVKLGAGKIILIKSEDYPTPAKRPRNSWLDLTGLREAFGIVAVSCRDVLAPELDALAAESQ